MKRTKKSLFLLFITLIFIMALPCIGHAAKINKKSATIVAGKSLKLKVSGTNKKVKWSSTKKSVATVTSKGIVSAKKYGKATIKAKIGKKIYKCKLTVVNPTLSVNNLTMEPNHKKTLKITGHTGNIFWESSNEDIADVTCKGKVIANSVGSCTIYAKVNGITLSCPVTVSIPDPECFPNKSLRINGVTINSFEAEYIGYKPYNDYSKDIENLNYYFPYIYRLKIKGCGQPNHLINLSFVGEMNGYTSQVPGNIGVSALTDAFGNFEIDEEIKFNCLSSKIYIIKAYTMSPR